MSEYDSIADLELDFAIMAQDETYQKFFQETETLIVSSKLSINILSALE